MKIQGIVAVKYGQDPGLNTMSRLVPSSVKIPLTAIGPWYDVDADQQHGEFEDSTEIVNGVTVHTSSLSFQMKPCADTSSLPIGDVVNCWKFKDRAGAWRLLGNGERPFPVATIRTENSGGNVETVSVTVSWKSKTGPLDLV